MPIDHKKTLSIISDSECQQHYGADALEEAMAAGGDIFLEDPKVDEEVQATRLKVIEEALKTG